MEIAGKIIEIKESQQISESFKKRTFVLEYIENPQYPEYVVFELVQDKCDLLDRYAVGQPVKVSFNLRGRKWMAPTGETKYFNSMQAWRIEPVTTNDSINNPPTGMDNVNLPSSSNHMEDDLPF